MSAAAVIASAQETTGLCDFGGDDWREALDVLTAADPIATVVAAYDQLGLAFTAEAELRMRRFLDTQPPHERGGHHYTFAQTGLDEQELRERTSRYQNYFGVPNEPLG